MSQKAQAETMKLFLALVLAIIAFILLAYFGYTYFTSKSRQFEQSVPAPIVPLAITPLFPKLISRLNKKGAERLPLGTLISVAITVIFAIVIAYALYFFFFGVGGKPG